MVPPSNAHGLPSVDFASIALYESSSHSVTVSLRSIGLPSLRSTSKVMATPVPLQAGGSWCAHAVPAPARASRVARVPLARARPDAAVPFLSLPSLESLNRLTIALRYAAGLPRRATRRIVRRPSSRFVPLADLATRASVGMRQRTAHAQGWSRRSLETTRGLRRGPCRRPRGIRGTRRRRSGGLSRDARRARRRSKPAALHYAQRCDAHPRGRAQPSDRPPTGGRLPPPASAGTRVFRDRRWASF